MDYKISRKEKLSYEQSLPSSFHSLRANKAIKFFKLAVKWYQLSQSSKVPFE